MTARNNNLQKGFTLIELLVVIGILAVLLAITLIAINPARQFAQANDTKRNSDVKQILNAIGAYIADNKGQIPTQIPLNTPSEIASGGADLCGILVPNYIPALPSDPYNSGGGDSTADVEPPCPVAYSTDYFVVRDANNRITVSAPDTEIAVPDISFTR